LLPSNVLASKSQYLVSVIDDEVDLVYLFKEALSQIKDLNVLAFSDPKLALEHFQKNSDYYKAVITDYRMPHITGLELLRKIRDVKPEIGTILISAFEIQDDLFQDCDCVDQFLQKPISLIDLINGVEKLVTKTNAVV
jgi:DNA-binding NtrC family response regulator